MKILLLGATGRTGKLILQEALESGYYVNCLARNSERIEKQNRLTIYDGNPRNQLDLEKAISGCQAVISALNISRKSDFPWSSLRTPKKYLSDVISHLIPIAEKQGIRKFVICSAWGAAETKSDIPKWFKWFIESSNIGVAYQDHERQEKMIEKSNLNWIIIRPVGLVNSKKVREVRESFENEPKPNLLISRRSLANYMVESLEREDLIGKKVVVSKSI